MATHSSILAWRIPWTEKPGGFSVLDMIRKDANDSDMAGVQTSRPNNF